MEQQVGEGGEIALTVGEVGATDVLSVIATPPFTVTKEFIDDPVAAGGPATLRFTITNNDSGGIASPSLSSP